MTEIADTSVWNRLEDSRSVRALRKQVATTHIPHAWLLVGPPGSGKGSASVAMAAALNCTVSPGDGCGTCSSCSRILRRRHPDVHHIVPEGPLIPVDVIRETVLVEAARSPFEGRRKVFVIEEAERMNDAAQSALLKTLEEPQPDTVFILISDEEDEILETIRSRCRIFRLEPVPEAKTVDLLRREGADEERALVAARISDGDVDRARTLALDPAAGARRSAWLDIPEQLQSPQDALGIAGEVIAVVKDTVAGHQETHKQEVVELADAMGEGRGTAAARNALAKRQRRELRRLEEETAGECLQTLGSFFRDVVALRGGGTEAITNLDVLDRVERWAATEVDDAAFIRCVERCIEARAALPKNANALLQLEGAFLDLARLLV
ncbi:MAG: DNA polymerase III subunit delta' [Actinomycetota bacterium]|nr:DNA polymerase III subunit delta' [Actinomycetota bacterium]